MEHLVWRQGSPEAGAPGRHVRSRLPLGHGSSEDPVVGGLEKVPRVESRGHVGNPFSILAMTYSAVSRIKLGAMLQTLFEYLLLGLHHPLGLAYGVGGYRYYHDDGQCQ